MNPARTIYYKVDVHNGTTPRDTLNNVMQWYWRLRPQKRQRRPKHLHWARLARKDHP